MHEFTLNGRRYKTPGQIRERIAALDQQYAGKHFPQDARDEWNELNQTFDNVSEFEVRADRLRELHRSGKGERVSDVFNRPNPRGSTFDGSARDAGLRTIER